MIVCDTNVKEDIKYHRRSERVEEILLQGIGAIFIC